VDLQALLFRFGDLKDLSRHIEPRAAIDNVHFGGTQAHCRPGGVDGRIASAHHCNALAGEVRRVAESDLLQELGAAPDAVLVLTRDAHRPADLRSQGQEHRGVAALSEQRIHGHVPSEAGVQDDLHSGAPNGIDLGVHH